MAATIAIAQEKEKNKTGDQEYKLSSEKLDEQGKFLDAQIISLCQDISGIIKRYDLLNTKGIRFVPYQTTYNLGQNFIEMEKHDFIKDELGHENITGIRTKKIKFYTTGQDVSKIESEVYERHYYSSEMDIVRISDPSPLQAGTDDMVFTHIRSGKALVDGRKLGDIKNTTAYPVRNEIKREFLVLHLTYFKNSLLFIAEAYYKSLKDTDGMMTDFLKQANKY
jgi:hypothetical protein